MRLKLFYLILLLIAFCAFCAGAGTLISMKSTVGVIVGIVVLLLNFFLLVPEIYRMFVSIGTQFTETKGKENESKN